MARRRPGIESARRFLEDLVARQRQTSEARLPGMRSLAQAAGVSYVTMVKAVGALREQGALTTRPRSRIELRQSGATLRASPELAQLPRPRQELWRTVSGKLAADILGRHFAPGSRLPSRKALAFRYGAGQRTIRRALAELAESRVVSAYGKGYRVPDQPVREEYGSVVLVARGIPDGGVFIHGTWTEEAKRTFEQECHRAGVDLLFHPHDQFARPLRLAATSPGLVAGTAARSATVGYFLWTVGMRGPRSRILPLLEALTTRGKPVAVLDEGDPPLSLPSSPGKLVRAFSPSLGVEAGVGVGRYLLGMGHRRIAYVSAVHGASWSQARLEGLCRVFAAAGAGDGVLPITRRDQSEARLDPALDFDRAFAAMVRGRQTAAGSTGRDARIVREAALLAETQIRAATSTVMLRDRMQPLLDQAIAHCEVTAWVAPNDEAATVCLDYLARKRVRVPEDVSVVGFDDASGPLSRRLTTWNPNYRAAIHGMLVHVLDPASPLLEPPGQGPAVAEGFVVTRGTCGRARG